MTDGTNVPIRPWPPQSALEPATRRAVDKLKILLNHDLSVREQLIRCAEIDSEAPQPAPRKSGGWSCSRCGADNPESWSYCCVCYQPKTQRKQA